MYSTDPDFRPELIDRDEVVTPTPGKQKLGIRLDRRNRAGKTVTMITGFVGRSGDRNDLCKQLKKFCGAGGSVKNSDLIIQGDFLMKIKSHLEAMGFKVVKTGG